jgi:hypothetical protein
MTTPEDASEAARALNRARWRDTVIRGAIRTLGERREQLSPEQLADLRKIAGEQEAGTDER